MKRLILAAIALALSATASFAAQCQYNTSAPVGTNGNFLEQQCDVSGNLKTSETDGGSVSGSVTSAAVLFTQDMLGYESITVQVTSAGSGTITYEHSDDNTNWASSSGLDGANVGSSGLAATTSTATGIKTFPRRGRYFRSRVSAYSSGTMTVVGTLSKSPATAPVVAVRIESDGASTTTKEVVGDAAHDISITGNPVRLGGRALTSNYTAVASGDTADLITTLQGSLVTKPWSIPEHEWSYPAAASGIVNTTTAVTIKAADATHRNYVNGCQIQTATLGAATELAIRDGAGGTVLWRTQLQTTAMPLTNVTFPNPLRGTAATLLEVVTLTAVTGGVYVNCQGYVAP